MIQLNPTDLLGRTVLGRYRVLFHLGAGGMGSVYLARAEGAAGFTKPVVLKHIHPALTVDPAASSMFVREARILSDIQHPGIVNVLDFGEEDGRYVMVLEYVHGYDLAQWVSYHAQKSVRFSLKLAVHLSQRVLAALHHAHTHTRADGTRMTIVHRDVSPGNVLLDLDGQVKLADFGIARICDEQNDGQSVSGQFKGKFAYSAPELLEGAVASPQSDVYAWGVIVYQLLSGANPFRDKQVADTVKRVLEFVPPPLGQARPDLPPALDAVLARALAKNRKERFADAVDFAQALRPFSLDSAEDAHHALTAAVRRDFLSDMPEVLGIVSLSERESTWRDDAGGVSVAELRSVPPAGSHEGATVVESGSKLLLDPLTVAQVPRVDLANEGRRSHPPAAGVAKRGSKLTAFAVVIGAVALLGAGAAILIALRDQSVGAQQVLIVDRRSLPDASHTKSRGAEAQNVDTGVQPGATTLMPGAASGATAEKKNRGSVGAAVGGVSTAEDAVRLSRAVQGHRGDFETCFERHVESVEGAPQLTLELTVGESGQVRSAAVAPSTVAETPLGGCVLSAAKVIQFPALGREVAFSVPLTARASR